MNNLRDAIDLLGGQAAVSRRFEIPYRTIQNWYRGERTPPTYVAKLITSFADDQEASHEAIDNLHFDLLDKEKELQEAAEREDEATRTYLQDQEWIREQDKELNKVKNDLKMVENALETEIEDNQKLREKLKDYDNLFEMANQEIHFWRDEAEALQEELKKTKILVKQKEKFIKSISHHIP